MGKLICNIYIFLWCLYGLQGTLYPTGSILARFLLVVLLLFSLYCVIVATSQIKMPSLLKMVLCLIIVFSVYGFVNILYGNGAENKVPSYYYLRGIYCSFLPLIVFYMFSKQGSLTENMLQKWLFVFLMIGITQFYRTQRLNLEALAERESNMEEATNNAGYIMLSIIPLIPLFHKRPLMQYSILSVCMVYVLLGMKRGAIIIGALCTTWFFFITLKSNRLSTKQVLRVVLTIIVVVAAVFFIQYMLQNSDYFNYRLEKTMEGDSSGRDALFSTYYNFFLNQSNLLRIAFGNGADATLRKFGEFAHNDWLEIAINNGVFVLLLYAVYWVVLFRTIRKSRKRNPTAHIILGLFFIVYFMKTIFSMSYNDVTIFSCAALGYALACLDSPETGSPSTMIEQ
jgi:hypothetical protein